MKVDDLGHIFKTTTLLIGMDIVLLQVLHETPSEENGNTSFIFSFSGSRMSLLFKEEDYLNFFGCCENGTQLPV